MQEKLPLARQIRRGRCRFLDITWEIWRGGFLGRGGTTTETPIFQASIRWLGARNDDGAAPRWHGPVGLELGQASMAVRSEPPIEILRGFAFSATGTVSRSTPPS
jgi:hypothetical protein